METYPLPCIVGPTGAGKTAAALALAKALALSKRAVIINADSRQVYADFPLITAQPSPEERARCPHLLYGFLPCTEKLGAGEYARLAEVQLRETLRQGTQPILVGGTGLYFRALLEGMAPIPDIPDSVSTYWQARCADEGSPALHRLLTERDPAYAAKIHPNDRQRISRALEVIEATGKAFSWWHAQPLAASPYRAIKVGVGLPMVELEPLLERRIEAMLAGGALEEARAALTVCAAPEAPGWSGIGCRELFDYLTGRESTLEACRDRWYKNTRAYAKRQYTWFRADPAIVWFSPDRTDELVAYVLEEIGDYLPTKST